MANEFEIVDTTSWINLYAANGIDAWDALLDQGRPVVLLDLVVTELRGSFISGGYSRNEFEVFLAWADRNGNQLVRPNVDFPEFDANN